MLIEMPVVGTLEPGCRDGRDPFPPRPVHVPAAGLAGSELAERFCFWRGRSGRRYVFSVYPLLARDDESLPRYPDAVIVIARRNAVGTRVIVSLGDSGSVPELSAVMAEALRARQRGDELHVHLLAGDRKGRSAVVEDLAGGAHRL